MAIDVIGLDNVVWKENWKPTPKEEQEKMESVIIQKSQWIVDGVSLNIQKNADTVVFLDCSRRVSYWRCLTRNVHYLFRSRPGLPADCPEIKIFPTLIKIIWLFPSRVKLKILSLAEQCSGNQEFYHITNTRELDDFIIEVKNKSKA